MRSSSFLLAILAVICLAVSVSALAGASNDAALQPAGSNAAQIKALQDQIAALKAADAAKAKAAKTTAAKTTAAKTTTAKKTTPAAAPKPKSTAAHYNVRESEVHPDGSKKTSGRFAKKPVTPVMTPWSAGIIAARAGDIAGATKAPTGPYTEPSRSWWGQSGNVVGGKPGWCGHLVNGWQMSGTCTHYDTCTVGTIRSDYARTYYCKQKDSSSFRQSEVAGGEKDTMPPLNLATTPVKVVVAPPTDRCGGCRGNQCCRLTAQTSDYYQCMNC